MKIDPRILRDGRYVVIKLAGVALPRALFLRWTDELRPRPPAIRA